jgi:Acyltransferase family
MKAFEVRLDHPESQIGCKTTSSVDWRPELVRLLSITVVIIFHIEFYTQTLDSSYSNPLVLLGGVAIGAFMVCSGYVHGLKNEFCQPGSLNGKTYKIYVKKRFLRLYLGYFLAINIVFLAKFLAGYTITFSLSGPLVFLSTNSLHLTPASLALDYSTLWSLVTGYSGGIWPEGWFVSAVIMLSLIYPLLRRIYSLNKFYLYSIIAVTIVLRVIIGYTVNPNYAYYFPFSWTAEFSIGILLGNYIRENNHLVSHSASYQKIIISLAARVWPLYLIHMAIIVFMQTYYSPLDIILLTLLIFAATEGFYHLLQFLSKRLGLTNSNKK